MQFLTYPLSNIRKTQKFAVDYSENQVQVFRNTHNIFPLNFLTIKKATDFLIPSTIPLGDLGQRDCISVVPLQLTAPARARLMELKDTAPSCALLLRAFTANTTTDLPLEAFRKPHSQDPQEHLYYSPFPPAGNLLHSTFKTGKEK